MKPLFVASRTLRFHALIGTGGVGSGLFFALDGNQTLGREESRSGRFLNQRDYCKLHIITQYVKTLLGAEYPVFPVSKVGDDDTGHRLLQEMEGAGLDTRFVGIDPDRQTLMSLCFLYPDGAGGNLTAADSACGRVDADFILTSKPIFQQYANYGLALAVPEVPLSALKAFLELATEYRFFRAASFTSGEIHAALEMGLLQQVDFLAINIDEAAALLDCQVEDENHEQVVKAAFEKLRRVNPNQIATITAGRHGSWAWDGENIHFVPTFQVKAVSTAGAGDAFMAGVIVGLSTGFSLPQSQELGTLVAALSVTSPHTIHPTLDRELLVDFIVKTSYPLSKEFKGLLGV